MGDLAKGDDYADFRAWVPRKVLVASPSRGGGASAEHDAHGAGDAPAAAARQRLPEILNNAARARPWVYYDWGPRKYPEAVLCLPGIHSGAADTFFQQILDLGGARGYRVIAVDLPLLDNIPDFCDALAGFLDALAIRRVHMYGVGLGGYLSLAFAGKRPERVASIALSNAFISTQKIRAAWHPLGESWVIRWTPEFVLKRMVLGRLPRGRAELRIAMAIEFVIARLLESTTPHLVSRLILSSAESNAARKVLLADEKITMIDTLDRFSDHPGPNDKPNLEGQLLDELVEQFPNSRRALLKTGGDFPHLSRPDEVNMHLVVHLRRNAPAAHTPPPTPPPARHHLRSPESIRRMREKDRLNTDEQETKDIPPDDPGRAAPPSDQRTNEDGTENSTDIAGKPSEPNRLTTNPTISQGAEAQRLEQTLSEFCDPPILDAALRLSGDNLQQTLRLLAQPNFDYEDMHFEVPESTRIEAANRLASAGGADSKSATGPLEKQRPPDSSASLGADKSPLEDYVNPMRDRKHLVGSGPSRFVERRSPAAGSKPADADPSNPTKIRGQRRSFSLSSGGAESVGVKIDLPSSALPFGSDTNESRATEESDSDENEDTVPTAVLLPEEGFPTDRWR